MIFWAALSLFTFLPESAVHIILIFLHRNYILDFLIFSEQKPYASMLVGTSPELGNSSIQYIFDKKIIAKFLTFMNINFHGTFSRVFKLTRFCSLLK